MSMGAISGRENKGTTKIVLGTGIGTTERGQQQGSRMKSL
jgi:hypothetical protein